jgi:hypothetical protein
MDLFGQEEVFGFGGQSSLISERHLGGGAFCSLFGEEKNLKGDRETEMIIFSLGILVGGHGIGPIWPGDQVDP